MRSGTTMRFVKVSARLQRRVAFGVAIMLALWTVTGAAVLASQNRLDAQQAVLAKEEQHVAAEQARVAAYRGSINELTHDLEARQTRLEKMHAGSFGPLPDRAAIDANAIRPAQSATKVSALSPDTAPLIRLEARQRAFAAQLGALADRRADSADSAIRKLGLNPRQMLRVGGAQGGPLIPASFGKNDAEFSRLARKLAHMQALEQLLAAIPTSKPAAITTMTSNFGYRSDPFTGEGAMHSGIDFRGAAGTSILAASGGKVTFAGVKGGYGNCLEITHRGGIVTRYAHLSAFAVRSGVAVTRGQRIAAMGSTGRSTGTHLHFEVRLNGRAVDPSKFLRANPDVFAVQAAAQSRSRSDV